MSDVKAEINKLNKNILQKLQQKHPYNEFCNRTDKKQCPHMENTESIIHQTNIRANISSYKEKIYFGVSETTFKICYANRNLSQKNIKTMGSYPRNIGRKKNTTECP